MKTILQYYASLVNPLLTVPMLKFSKRKTRPCTPYWLVIFKQLSPDWCHSIEDEKLIIISDIAAGRGPC